jgi:hypothetical protein
MGGLVGLDRMADQTSAVMKKARKSQVQSFRTSSAAYLWPIPDQEKCFDRQACLL